MWIAALFLLAFAPSQDSGATAAPAPAQSFDDLLRVQPYFKKIVWTTDSSFAPFEILIQKQAVPEPGFETKVSQFFGPWLVRIAKTFEERVALPAKLPPGNDPRPIRLIVLLSEGDYLNYTKSITTWDGYDPSAYYDDRIRAVVTRWDNPGADLLRRYQVLRRFVIALLHQRWTGIEGRQPPFWLREGLGRMLAWNVGNDPAIAFTKPGTDPQLLDLMVSLSQDTAKQNRFLMPFETLVAVTSYSDLRKRALASARELNVEFNDNDPWYGGFMSQAALWTEYLQREGAPEHNAAFASYLQAGMRGGGGLTDLFGAFPEASLAALDRDFFRWAYARVDEPKKSHLDAGKLATLFVKQPKETPSPGSLSKGAKAPPAPREPSIAERLALPLGDAKLARAISLRKATQGDIEGALGDIAAAIARGGSDNDMAALRTDSERLTAWKTARDAWLADMLKTGARLQIERDGKPISRKVTAIEGGVLTLESAQGNETLAIGTLKPGSLATQMKTPPPGTPEWVRAFAWILDADPRWEKLLKDKSEAAQTLRADANGAYLVLRQLGAAAAHLTALAAASDPKDETAARAVLDVLGATMRESSTHQLIVERRATLLALGDVAGGVIYDATKPAPTFAGKTTWIDADTIELAYDFNSASDLDDWVQGPVNSEQTPYELPALSLPEDKRGFKCESGAWTGRGSSGLTLRLPLEAPIHINATIRHGFAESDDIDIGHCILGICVDPTQGYLAFTEGGSSYLNELKTSKYVSQKSSHVLSPPPGDPITLEIADDGASARYTHFGTAEPALENLTIRSGEIYLLEHTNRVFFLDSIRIRGKLNAASRAKLRGMWIEKTLSQKGLR